MTIPTPSAIGTPLTKYRPAWATCNPHGAASSSLLPNREDSVMSAFHVFFPLILAMLFSVSL